MSGVGYKGTGDEEFPYAGSKNYLTSDVSQGMAVTGPKTRSPVDRVSTALSDARDLSNRVRAIVDTLIGCRPEDSEKRGGNISGGGIVMALADNADETAATVRQAQDDLHRLSQVLALGL